MSARPVDAATFKSAMRHYPTGVTVVTSLREGEPRGMTLNAFASVSAEPPTVLVCVNREARSYLYIATSRIFCINLLAHEQVELAHRFSGKTREHQFDDIGYDTAETGAPVLRGTIGYFDCAVTHEHHAGSHSIFIAEVVACHTRAGAPLGYYNGAFADFGMRINDDI